MKTAESHNAPLTGAIYTTNVTPVLPFTDTPVVPQMRLCPAGCGTECTRNANFCSFCGQPFYAGSTIQPFEGLRCVCPLCGTHLQPVDNYCSTCGYKVVNSP